VRFLIDASLSAECASWFTAYGHDAVHASALGLLQAADEEILRRAVADQRIVVTTDLDFSELIAVHHLDAPGLLLIRLPEATFERLHARLTAVLRVITAEDMTQAITVVEEDRVRIRKLPIS